MLQSQEERYYNPLGLIIGQEVIVTHESLVDYDYNSVTSSCIKQVQRKPSRQRTFIVGVVKKALGTYHKAKRYSNPLDPGDYEQAYLQVSKYIWLYETRRSINSKIVLASPEDIHLL